MKVFLDANIFFAAAKSSKDVPILLGALLSGAEALITLDKKDFLNNQKLRDLKLPFGILNSENFLKKYF
ncbi:MAG: hypothetical protein AAB405_00580 [Patescibacteria group bacterium]